MVKLIPLWELSKAREEPIAIIGIKDLKLAAPSQVGADGWGWSWDLDNCPPQPIIVSVSLSLLKPFKTASEVDDITEDTIHYGRIRSGILEAIGNYNSPEFSPDGAVEVCPGMVMGHLVMYFTSKAKLTTGKNINWCSFKIMLPKSSLLGAGCSLTVEVIYKESLKDKNGGKDTSGAWGRACTLRVHDITVPTIIGILDKERMRKQNVVANVEIDKWDWFGDFYWDVEQIVLKAIEESSFQTLEALAEHIGKYVTRYFVIPHIMARIHAESAKAANKWKSFSEDYTKVPWKKTEVIDLCPIIKIKLEKPSIYIDTTPGVEMTMDIRPLPNSPYFSLWNGYKRLRNPKRPFVGTLKDWIAKNHPEDLEGGEATLVDLQQKVEAFQVNLAESKKFTDEINSRPLSSKNNPEDLGDRESSPASLQRKMEAFQANLAESKRITDDINSRPSSSKNNPEDLGDIESSPASLQRKMEAFQANLAESKRITDDINSQPSSSSSKPSQQLGEEG